MALLSAFGLLTVFPLAATAIGIVLLLYCARAKIRTGVATGILWIVASIYECLMYLRILCAGECNIPRYIRHS